MPLIAPNEVQGVLGSFQTNRTNVTVAPADPATLTSSTSVYKMAGCAVKFTPVQSTLIEVVVVGVMGNDTASDNVLVQLAYGTGSAPAKNGAAAGTQFGSIVTLPVVGTTKVSFTCLGVFTAVLGTTYWLDLASEAVTGGNVILQNLTFVVKEY